MGFGATDHPLSPPVLDRPLRHLRPVTIEAIERARGDVEIELGAVSRQRFAETVKHLDRRAARILFGLNHQGGTALMSTAFATRPCG